jgi:hypothetical protein
MASEESCPQHARESSFGSIRRLIAILGRNQHKNPGPGKRRIPLPGVEQQLEAGRPAKLPDGSLPGPTSPPALTREIAYSGADATGSELGRCLPIKFF